MKHCHRCGAEKFPQAFIGIRAPHICRSCYAETTCYCSGCDKRKPRRAFGRHRTKGRQAWCRRCNRSRYPKRMRDPLTVALRAWL